MALQRFSSLALSWLIALLFVESISFAFAFAPSRLPVGHNTLHSRVTQFSPVIRSALNSLEDNRENELCCLKKDDVPVIIDFDFEKEKGDLATHTFQSFQEIPFHLVLSAALTLGVMVVFGTEAFAETSPIALAPLSPNLSSSHNLGDELVGAIGFVGDVLGSLINLLYQVILVLLPIIGKAIVAAFKAAVPAIKQGLLAFFEYVKVAAKASGDAALPFVNEAREVSTPYLKQVGSTVNDAATVAGSAVTVKAELTKSAVQNVATEQIKTVNTALQNVATQAKTSIRQ